MKKILLLCLIAMLNLEAQALQEKHFSIQTNLLKQIITCSNGTQSYILKKGNLFYSDTNKVYNTQNRAIQQSCKTKHLYTKQNAIVCESQKDILSFLKHKINPSMYKNCLRVSKSIPLNILNHYPLSIHSSYYQAQNKDKIFYIDRDATYTKRTASHYKHTSKHRTHKKKKYNHKTKHKIKEYHHKRKKSHYKRKENRQKHHKKHIIHKRKQTKIKSNRASIKHQENITKYIATPVHTTRANEQYYTYKCIATHGTQRLYTTNDTSMSLASDSVWRHCQVEKAPEEVCKITDCYKLIK